MLKIYCDGACSGNPGPGGWAFVIPELNIEMSGYEPNTTNNRMEITAVYKALKYLYDHLINLGEDVEIITDSQYVVNTMTQGWKKNKNQDLWAYLDDYRFYFTNIKWTWVKGHASNEYNNRCDELAVAEYKNKKSDLKANTLEQEFKFEEAEIFTEEVEVFSFDVRFHLVKKFILQPGDRIYRLYECPSFLKNFFVLENSSGEVVTVGDYNTCLAYLSNLKHYSVDLNIK